MSGLILFPEMPQLEMVLKLVMATLFGGVVGYERELSDKPAGLRTHILVCLGSALFTLASLFGFGQGSDPARVAAQVVTGVGFLGAGTILRTGATVRGLTTAASIWAVAAVGVAVGVGMYLLAVVSTFLVAGVLRFSGKLSSNGDGQKLICGEKNSPARHLMKMI